MLLLKIIIIIIARMKITALIINGNLKAFPGCPPVLILSSVIDNISLMLVILNCFTILIFSYTLNTSISEILSLSFLSSPFKSITVVKVYRNPFNEACWKKKYHYRFLKFFSRYFESACMSGKKTLVVITNIKISTILKERQHSLDIINYLCIANKYSKQLTFSFLTIFSRKLS